MQDCPLCRDQRTFHFETTKRYLQCPECRLIFLKPEYRLTEQAEHERYLTHQNNVQDKGYQDFVAPLVQQIKKKMSPSELGLDFGCGPGPVVTYLLEKEGYSVNCFDPYFKNEPELLENLYDFVFLCEVAEHFYDPRLEFDKLVTCLRKKRVLFVKTELYDKRKSFETWYYKNDPTHVCFYTAETMRWLQQHYAFEQMELIPGNVTVFSGFLNQNI